MLAVLEDLAVGANSALERRYLVDVERAHRLPVGRRQQRVANGRLSAYRDVYYEGLHTVVELDGRLGHDSTTDRWDDLDRDIAAAIAGDVTIRAGWRQTLNACRLAVAVGGILQSRGWTGSPMPCAAECPVRTGEDLRLPVPGILAR